MNLYEDPIRHYAIHASTSTTTFIPFALINIVGTRRALYGVELQREAGTATNITSAVLV
jgi:hypothetical protein